jgi:hypothetical protein
MAAGSPAMLRFFGRHLELRATARLSAESEELFVRHTPSMRATS